MSEAGPLSRAAVAARIDHTLLDPGATGSDLDRLCDEAVANGCAAVCVNPVWVARCARRIARAPVKVCSVAGFPLGAQLTEVRVLEVRRAVEAGAAEVDVVMFLGALRGGEFDRVREDLVAVVSAASPAEVKAILETGRLTPGERIAAARIAVEAGAAFVKTSTGFGGSGATVEDVRLLRQIVGPDIGVKAAGGIRTWQQAVALLGAGASRLGASASLEILAGKGPS